MLDIAGDLFMDPPETDLTYTQEELDNAMELADKIAEANRVSEEKEESHV